MRPPAWESKRPRGDRSTVVYGPPVRLSACPPPSHVFPLTSYLFSLTSYFKTASAVQLRSRDDSSPRRYFQPSPDRAMRTSSCIVSLALASLACRAGPQKPAQAEGAVAASPVSEALRRT